MSKPTVAVLSFPGNNCEVESVRALRASGMEARFFRWNDDRRKLENIDGYFIPGGFSYEDRGRSGMVAARDPLMEFLGQEAERGKAIIGNCNGAQILVESGIIPLSRGLRMALARNVDTTKGKARAVGFLSQWVWITPSCPQDRCVTSDWTGAMHIPIAHGEGRFETRDPDLLEELKKDRQLAFSYCDIDGRISTDPSVNPNGSACAIAGICNPAGNVVALMPHPERTPNGKPYFDSMRSWLKKKRLAVSDKRLASTSSFLSASRSPLAASPFDVPLRKPQDLEIFIDTIIVNNEERTVEQAARRVTPTLRLKQWKYFSLPRKNPLELLSDLAIFNPNKERAFIRQGTRISRWNAEKKKEEDTDATVFQGTLLLRRDVPETTDEESGVCYELRGVSDAELQNRELLEIFANPHSSSLERITT